MAKKVFVSGCYDMLHSGHVAFFTEAAEYGDLYVGIGSDRTISGLKARQPVNSEQERLYMVKALRVVKDAWINSGTGLMDFEEDLRAFGPDIFFVNEDGHTPAKEEFCRRLGIEYIVGRRKPHEGLPARSTTALRQECRIPYRIDLAGGWLDQPEVSKYSPGSVITLCIEPDFEFNDRSGMATSSRKKAVELWRTDVPEGNREKLAKTLFCYENPPGNRYVSGSQDAIGIVYPGLNKLKYAGDFWPESVESVFDETVLAWLEKHIRLIQLYPRDEGYDVYENSEVTSENASKLAVAAEKCWKAIENMDLNAFGRSVTESFRAQVALFPNMTNEYVDSVIERYKNDVCGYKLSGAGGGGYLIFITENEIPRSVKIRVRHK